MAPNHPLLCQLRHRLVLMRRTTTGTTTRGAAAVGVAAVLVVVAFGAAVLLPGVAGGKAEKPDAPGNLVIEKQGSLFAGGTVCRW